MEGPPGPIGGPYGGPYWRALGWALCGALLFIIIGHFPSSPSSSSSCVACVSGPRMELQLMQNLSSYIRCTAVFSQYWCLQKNARRPIGAQEGDPFGTPTSKIFGSLMILVPNGPILMFEPIWYANWDPTDLSGMTD